MRRVVLDSDAVDPIVNLQGAYGVLKAAVDSKKLDVTFPDVTLDQLAAVGDLERRRDLLRALVALGHLVPSGAAIVGISRFGFSRVSDDSVETLRSGSTKHSHDALIAATAHMDGSALVTHDRRLTARARDLGIEVLTTRELLAEFGFEGGDTS